MMVLQFSHEFTEEKTMNINAYDYREMAILWNELVKVAISSQTDSPCTDDTTDDVSLFVLVTTVSLVDIAADTLSPTARFWLYLAEQRVGINFKARRPEEGYSSFQVTDLYYDCRDIRKAKRAVKNYAAKYGIFLA